GNRRGVVLAGASRDGLATSGRPLRRPVRPVRTVVRTAPTRGKREDFMSFKLRRTLLGAAAWMLLGGGTAWGQTGAIVGRVTSSEGATAIAAAFAEAQSADGRTAASSVTDSDGRYRLIGVAPGTYTVVVSAVGYQTLRVADVMVTAGSTTTVDAP